MSKKLIYILSVLLLIVTVLLIIPNIIKWDAYKDKITTKINELSPDYKLTIIGKMHVKILPWPSIVFKNCFIERSIGNKKEFLLKAANIKGSISLWDMLRAKARVKKLTIIGGVTSLSINNKDHKGSFISYKNSILSIEEINFRKSDISFTKNKISVVDFNNSNVTMHVSDKKLTINGSFSPTKFEKLNINFELAHDKNDIINIKTNFNSSCLKLLLTGKLSTERDIWKITGQSDISINNLSSFSEQYLANLLPFFKYVSSTESLTIQSNVVISEEEITFKDLNIKSNSIEASGAVSDLITNAPVIDINLVFNKLDFDLLTKQTDVNANNIAEQKALRNLMQNTAASHKYSYTMPKGLDLLLYLDIKNAIYNGQHISNSKLNAELSQGVMELYNLVLNFGQETKVEVEGTLNSNDTRPSFSGVAKMQGNSLEPLIKFVGYSDRLIQNPHSSFNFYGKIIATPKELKLYKIDSIINDLSVQGNITYRIHKQLHIDADLNLHSLNLDEYLVTQKLTDIINLIRIDNYNYLEQLQWLRTIKYEASLNLHIKNLIVNKYIFPVINASVYMAPSIMQIEDINISSPDIDLQGALALDIRYLRPKLFIYFNGNKYNHGLFTKLLPPKENSTNVQAVEQHSWSNDVIPFNMINTFDGEMKLNIDNVIINNVNLEKFSLASKLNNYVLDVESLKADVFGGNFASTGVVSTQPMIISASYALNNIFAEQLLSKIFNINNISGYLSTNGSFTTQGNTPASIISQLNAEFIVAARQVKVEGLNVDTLVNSTNDSSYNIQGFDQLLQSAFSDSSLFNSIDGKFSIIKGLLQTKSLELTTNRVRGGLSGNVDLKSWLMSIIAEFAFIPKINAQPVSFTINLTGNINKPDKQIKADPLKNYLMSNTY